MRVVKDYDNQDGSELTSRILDDCGGASACFNLAEELQIFSFPTTLFYKNGELVTSVIGSVEERELLNAAAQILY